MSDVRRFRNRGEAGDLLASRLAEYAHRPDALVLALPRGGVPVGAALARRLGLALDVLLVRKLGLPGHEEYAIGAIGAGGVRVLRRGACGVSTAELDAVAARELAELARRERLYRGARPAPVLAQRSAILVDDGIATGASMLAAIEVARRLRPRELVLAVPVAPPEAVATLAPLVERLVCLASPARFRAVGEWYAHFEQTSDREVQDLLAAAAPDPNN